MKKSLCRLALLAVAVVSLCSVPAFAQEPANSQATDTPQAVETVPTAGDAKVQEGYQGTPNTTLHSPEAIFQNEAAPDLLYKHGHLSPQQRAELYEKIVKELGLTAEQKQKIDPIVQEYREGYFTEREKYKSRIAAIIGTPYLSQFDLDTMTIAQRNQLRQVLREMIITGKASILDFRSDIRPLLTEAQRKKLASILVNWYENRIFSEFANESSQEVQSGSPAKSLGNGCPPPPEGRHGGPGPRGPEGEMGAHGAPFGPPPPEMVADDLAEQLNLTAEQQEQVLSILKKSEQNLRKARQEVRDQLEAEMTQGEQGQCQGKDAKCQGKDAKCQGKDAKCQGKDAKCQGKDAKCQGKDGKCDKHRRHGKPHNEKLGQAIREKIHAEREAAAKEINAILTPEQQTKFAEIMAKFPTSEMAPPPGHHPRGDMRPHRDAPPCPPDEENQESAAK